MTTTVDRLLLGSLYFRPENHLVWAKLWQKNVCINHITFEGADARWSSVSLFSKSWRISILIIPDTMKSCRDESETSWFDFPPLHPRIEKREEMETKRAGYRTTQWQQEEQLASDRRRANRNNGGAGDYDTIDGLKENQNAPRPSEHPPVRGKKCQNV